jgi:hypothetical protein
MDSANLPPSGNPDIDLGTWIGRGQAFALMQGKCSAAQARCLMQVRVSKAFEALGITWEDFCVTYLGISRSQADKLIRRLEEFGESYFQLSQIMDISVESYRRLSPAISEEGLEFDGEVIAIVPENAAAIKKAVSLMRSRLHKAEEQARRDPCIIEITDKLNHCFDLMEKLTWRPLDRSVRAALMGLTGFCQHKSARIARLIDKQPAPDR